MLEITKHDRVIYLQVPEPASSGEEAIRLALALIEACEDIEQGEERVAAVVLASSRSAFFLAEPRGGEDCDIIRSVWAKTTAAVGRLTPPTIAALAGNAVGAAWELALACDLRLATSEVLVGSPELRWGRIPAAGGTQRLSRLVGPALALRLLLCGELLDAPSAAELGLIHRVISGDLMAVVEDYLKALRAAAPLALAYVKEAVSRGIDLPLMDGLRLEADLSVLLQTTRDRAEGIEAYRGRRAPHFEGR